MRLLLDQFHFLFFSFSRMNYIICLVLLTAYAEACNEQDIEIAAGEVLKGAIASERRGRRGKYPNNACQIWNIRAEETKLTKLNILYFIV